MEMGLTLSHRLRIEQRLSVEQKLDQKLQIQQSLILPARQALRAAARARSAASSRAENHARVRHDPKDYDPLPPLPTPLRLSSSTGAWRQDRARHPPIDRISSGLHGHPGGAPSPGHLPLGHPHFGSLKHAFRKFSVMPLHQPKPQKWGEVKPFLAQSPVADRLHGQRHGTRSASCVLTSASGVQHLNTRPTFTECWEAGPLTN